MSRGSSVYEYLSLDFKSQLKLPNRQFKRLGVRIETNVIVGKSVTIDELMDVEGWGRHLLWGRLPNSWYTGKVPIEYFQPMNISQEAI